MPISDMTIWEMPKMYAFNVTATNLPAQSLLSDRITSTDFLDCYSVASDLSPRHAAKVITAFPGWARFLLRIRRGLTSPFGLSNDGPTAPDKVGIFPVEAENNRELIAGFDDKHLNFGTYVLILGLMYLNAQRSIPILEGKRLMYRDLIADNGLASGARSE